MPHVSHRPDHVRRKGEDGAAEVSFAAARSSRCGSTSTRCTRPRSSSATDYRIRRPRRDPNGRIPRS